MSRILREIGRGGMGIVYEARQVSLGRKVALKVLPFAAVLDQNQVVRFQNEAQAAAQLNHPHIVPVFAVGSDRGVYFYSMQYIEGQSLDQALGQMRSETGWHLPSTRRSGERDPETNAGRGTVRGFTTRQSIGNRHYVRASVELMVQAADALHHAHECGVIHRDVKPSNLLVDRHGKLWVTDFGLARSLARSLSHSPLTSAGSICGTLCDMSPEQASGRAALVDQRTDVYALGVTLYETLALRTPFVADDREQLLQQIARDEPQPLRRLNPAVPPDLETIVLKALSKSRDERYDTAAHLAADLRRFLNGQPTVARRPTRLDLAARWVARRARWVVAALLVMILGLAVTAVVAIALAQANHRTQRALSEAELHLLAARKTVDEFSARLSEQLADVPGAERVRLAALERAQRFYEEFLHYAAQAGRRSTDCRNEWRRE